MGAVERYADEICREIRDRQEEIRATLGLNTLYIGGGTPSVLPLPVLRRIVEALSEVTGVPVGPAAAVCAEGAGGRERGRAAADERKRDQTAADERYEEFTIEVNPEDIVERGPEYVRALLDLGVTRISMGVQSLDDGILRWMNRRHDAARARQAWRIIRGLVPQGVEASQDLRHPRLRGRCPSVMGGAERSEAVGEAFSPCGTSVDLIIGVPGMTDEILEATLKELVTWRPDHISAYQLSIEEGSTLAERIAKGLEKEAPEEQCRAQYEMVCRTLAAAGYEHYEISNWALPGKRSIHNSAYWTRHPYVGLGPGAHSLTIETSPKGLIQRRSWNSKALSGWTRESELLGAEEIREERIMLGLRTAEGIAPELLAAGKAGQKGCATPYSLAQLQQGLVCEGRCIRIPEKDWFIADDIIVGLL